jgi:hypothetical protein
MPRILLPVISSTKRCTVLKKPPGTSALPRPRGDIDRLCGTCHQTLAECSYSNEAENNALRCPIRRSLNLKGAPALA